MSGTSYRADLAAIPADWQDEVTNYFDNAVFPRNRLILAVIAGDYLYALEEVDPDLCALIRFMNRHCPPFAHGSPERMVRWQFLKQMLEGHVA